MDKIKNFFRHETVLCIAFLAALISMIFVPPSREYLDYINWRVLGLLWCLMAVVAGFRRCGVFETLTVSLLARSRGKGRLLALLLVLLPFFSAMLITNDVALLTFVPFTLGVLQTAGCMAWAPYLLVLQTAAAVLGSAATPVGDPHNLFVYASYAMTPGEFFSAALPVVGICALGLIAAALPALPADMPVSKLWKPEPIPPKRCAIYCALFVLCLLAVFRAVPWWIAVIVVFIVMFFTDRIRLREPDYFLLLTFVVFFVFSGNIGRIPAVRSALQRLTEQNVLMTGALASQVISNVPAAVLLAPFTDDPVALMIGTDIGGFGTPIASMANLITLKLYLRTEDCRAGRYFLYFAIVNAAGFALMTAAALLTGVG